MVRAGRSDKHLGQSINVNAVTVLSFDIMHTEHAKTAD
jgi:hypothetical protein